jgi:ferredoxin
VKGTCKVTILPQKRVVETPPGVSLRFLLMKHDCEIPFPCGGEGICGRCRVLFSKAPPTPNIYDRRNLSEEELSKGVRLACKAVIEDHCEVILPQADNSISLISKGDILMPLQELIETPSHHTHCVGIDLGTTTLFVSIVDVAKKEGWRGERLPTLKCPGEAIS